MAQPDEQTVVCLTEEAARAEAELRNQNDPEPDRFTWTWLHLDGHWVAKRYPRDDKPAAKSDGLINWIVDLWS